MNVSLMSAGVKAMEIKLAKTRKDLRACVAIWMEASLAGHPFIPARFWRAHQNAMLNEYLPESRVHMVLRDGIPIAFAAMRDAMLAALFCLPEYWGTGTASELLRSLQRKYSEIILAVYAKNSRALGFYTKHGFAATGSSQCPLTGEKETLMLWQAVFS